MGNSNPYPRYAHPYPPPLSFTFTEYLKQCSYNFDKNIKNLFDSYYKGKIVQWKGLVTGLSDKEAKFLINPTDAEYSDSELTLLVDKSVRSDFVEKQESVFRGSLVSFGLLKNHVVQQVPFDDKQFPVDYSITYDSFLYYFGAKGQKAGSEYFTKYWKKNPITMEGTYDNFRNIDHSSDSSSQDSTLINMAAEFTFVPTEIQYAPAIETVKVRIPNSRHSLVRQVRGQPNKSKIIITATFVSRTFAHILELSNVTIPQSECIGYTSAIVSPFQLVPQYVPSTAITTSASSFGSPSSYFPNPSPYSSPYGGGGGGYQGQQQQQPLPPQGQYPPPPQQQQQQQQPQQHGNFYPPPSSYPSPSSYPPPAGCYSDPSQISIPVVVPSSSSSSSSSFSGPTFPPDD